MKKKDIISIIVVIMVIAVICARGNYENDMENKKAAAEASAIDKNNNYTQRLHIKGNFSYEGSKVYAENLKYNDKRLMIDVAYVNYCNGNEQYTIEQLYKEYEAFLNGESKEKYCHLDEYIKYINKIYNFTNSKKNMILTSLQYIMNYGLSVRKNEKMERMFQQKSVFNRQVLRNSGKQ